MTEELNNEDYIQKLEGMLMDLAVKANSTERKGEDDIVIDAEKQYIYEELVRQRRRHHEEQFVSIQDDYEY